MTVEDFSLKRHLIDTSSHFDRMIHLNSDDQTCRKKPQMRGGIEETKVDIKPFVHEKTDTILSKWD